MKPAAFAYHAAETLEQALALKAQHGDEARWLAGGQSLLPAMNLRLARPAALIDINPLATLDHIAPSAEGGLRIGALTRYRSLERDPRIARDQPLLREALGHVAHPQIRNRGTLCGNLAHADPASELPAVMLALDARLQARSAAAARWIAAADFFRDLFTTALAPDELLVEVELPKLPARTGTCFLEVARRRGDFALMGVAAVVTLAADGVCAHASLAYCNAGATPQRPEAAARALIGRPVGAAEIDEAAALARRAIDPPGSVHAGADFQRHLAGVLTRRALRQALDRATAPNGTA
jgi:CO/xanthine dehydrogenase FAD-binding subunit